MDRAIENAGGLQISPDTPVVTLINVFTPKPGMLAQFCSAQIGEYRRLSGLVSGSLGANLHEAIDGRRAANYAQFASESDYCAWRDGALFAAHLDVIKPFVAKVEPLLYDVIQVGRPAPSNDKRGGVIRLGGSAVTLIHRHKVRDSEIDAYSALLKDLWRQSIDQVSGLISVNLHRARDEPAAASYIQFEDEGACRAWTTNEAFAAFEQELQPFVIESDPGVYRVAYTLHEPGSALTD